AQGNHRAQYNLGLLYAAGDGVPRDLGQAEAYFRAAASELPAAAARLAEIRRSPRPTVNAVDHGRDHGRDLGRAP
ncbi:MAG: SEL1-like repeat protein, partial [Acetobacteraceae bacterium]|nr:SEL1-like repeat protein [Acetobacteraceae bacterium]